MISGYLIGDKALVAKIDGAYAKIKTSEIDPTVRKLGYALQLRVQQNYLRGPRPSKLGVVTGRLLRSITQTGGDGRSRFVSTETSAIFYVGTNVEYAAGWEYGFTRKVGAGARGGPKTLTGKARETYFAKHPPGVRAVAARPFLAPALNDMRSLIVDELTAALQRGATEALK
jgi:phage gpG-like protein